MKKIIRQRRIASPRLRLPSGQLLLTPHVVELRNLVEEQQDKSTRLQDNTQRDTALFWTHYAPLVGEIPFTEWMPAVTISLNEDGTVVLAEETIVLTEETVVLTEEKE